MCQTTISLALGSMTISESNGQLDIQFQGTVTRDIAAEIVRQSEAIATTEARVKVNGKTLTEAIEDFLRRPGKL